MERQKLDLRGHKFMIPITKLAAAMKKTSAGEEFEVLSDYQGFDVELEEWCTVTGNELLELTEDGRLFKAIVIKR